MEEIPIGKFGFVKRESFIWIKHHLSKIVGTGFVVLAGIIALTRLFKGDAQVDFLAADIAYQHWEGVPGEHLSKLQKILRKHPELHAKYDGAIAQKLLNSSEQGLAMSYAKAALKRMEGFSPYYIDFSQSSLLIAENKLEEALSRSKALKSSMEKDDGFWEKKSEIVRHGCILYAYNLLRIAMLEKAAGTPEGELLAWKEFKENGGTSKVYDPEAYQLIQSNFQNDEISLLDYIKHREDVLAG